MYSYNPTEHSETGLSWYINGYLSPDIYVKRDNKYRFMVQGGSNPYDPKSYHPLIITGEPLPHLTWPVLIITFLLHTSFMYSLPPLYCVRKEEKEENLLMLWVFQVLPSPQMSHTVHTPSSQTRRRRRCGCWLALATQWGETQGQQQVS